MQTNSDTSPTGHPTRQTVGHRHNIPEAAKILSLTEEAVRQRVKRGTLDSIKVDGKLFVLLDTDTSSDQEQPVIDTSTDTSRLVDALESEVAHLRRQLEQANERDRENRRIIAALTSRIPELLPSSMSEPRETSETVSEEAAKDHLPPKPEQRRSWLSRFFFGP